MAHWKPDPDNDGPPRGRGGLFWAVVVMALVAGFAVAAFVAFPRARPDIDPGRLVYLAVVLAMAVLVGGSMLRENPWRALGQLAIWVGFGGALALAYTYRADLGFAPGPAAGTAAAPADAPRNPTFASAATGDRSVTLYARNGHFFADAEVEGKTLTFMVDTGASVIALSRDDARRLGITPSERDFNQLVSTANGTTRGAPVTLDSVGIGPIDIRYVDAMVVEGDMPGSLLGMSFLSRLSGYQVTGDRLVLRQ